MKRIMRKIITAVSVFVLSVLFCIPTAAQESDEGFAYEYPRLMDMADLLSDDEEAELLTALDEVSERQKLEVAVVTIDTLDGYDIVSFADDLYEDCQFGYGPAKDGVMLLISMEDRDWYINTKGYGISVFTDKDIQYIGEQIRYDLSEEDYAEAFLTFVQNCDELITLACSEEAHDASNLLREPMSAGWILASLIVGIIIALVIVGGMMAQLKSVRFQPRAEDYIKEGSLRITQRRDLFLYRTVDRTEKPKDTNQKSSTHYSSSGEIHGGGGGKF